MKATLRHDGQKSLSPSSRFGSVGKHSVGLLFCTFLRAWGSKKHVHAHLQLGARARLATQQPQYGLQRACLQPGLSNQLPLLVQLVSEWET